jgi:hypothetical protein
MAAEVWAEYKARFARLSRRPRVFPGHARKRRELGFAADRGDDFGPVWRMPQVWTRTGLVGILVHRSRRARVRSSFPTRRQFPNVDNEAER